jgi:hypothetical protein
MLIIGEKLSIIAKRSKRSDDEKDKGPHTGDSDFAVKAGAGMIDASISPPAEDGGEDLMQWMVTTATVVPLPSASTPPITMRSSGPEEVHLTNRKAAHQLDIE